MRRTAHLATMKGRSLLFALILLAPGCLSSENSVEPDEEDIGCTKGFTASEQSVHEGFELVLDDDPQNTIFDKWEGGSAEGFVITNETAREGEKSMRVDITPEDSTQSGSGALKNRAEFGIRAGHGECAEVWYGWSIFIPENFTERPDGGTGFNVITQWHDRSGDPANPTSNNPPMSILYGARDGQTGLVFKYGLDGVNQHVFAEVLIEKGVWHDLVYHIGWSQEADGFAEVWLDDSPVTNGTLTGPNMHNELPHYWKAGHYRGVVGDDATLTNNSIYFDAFGIGPNRQMVDPGA